MDRLLQFVLSRFIRKGSFRLITSRGTAFQFGDGTGTPVTVRFSTRQLEWAILKDPELKFGEGFMDGTLIIEQGTIADVLKIVMGQSTGVGGGESPQWSKMQWLLRFVRRRIAQFNSRGRSQKNVAHHYDLDGRLYSLFLDADEQYSCAYFEHPEQSLDDAQLAKKRHLAAKLLIPDNARVLDIGCGWGGLGLYLAEMTNAKVTGITLSKEQHGVANARAAERGLGDRAQFRLTDYRDLTEKFDRIVSVGMFEHVGVTQYPTFFETVARVLDENGVMVLHSIGRPEGPGITNPWIAKYIFPGGYIPALSEILPLIERNGLLIADIEILRLHYAETLKHWRDRFLAHREDVERIYDKRFVRMWEFYLAASEMSFREQNMMVMQIQLTKNQNVLPITRDYMMRAEERLRALERESRPPLRLAGE